MLKTKVHQNGNLEFELTTDACETMITRKFDLDDQAYVEIRIEYRNNDGRAASVFLTLPELTSTIKALTSLQRQLIDHDRLIA